MGFFDFIFGKNIAEVNSFWVLDSDLSTNPFSDNARYVIDVYQVLERKEGLATAKGNFFLKVRKNPILGDKSFFTIVERDFLHSFTPYDEKTIETWGLKKAQ